MSRFIVGIDLGTTNSVVAYADATAGDGAGIQVLALPQVVNPGTIEPRELLPSFLYLAAPGELPAAALDLPWAKQRDFVVGEFAHKRGLEVPARLVASAKSWLSYAGADRTGPILPWGAGDDVPKLSPVDASARYLTHMRDAWNHVVAAGDKKARLEAQEVVLTVPASFDPVARELTARAAQQAGFEHVTLLEEPQAAVYAWIEAGGDAWRQTVHVGDVILVCDVGGGTTDLTLIAVREQAGALSLERVAVGDHILLGGDNMDLTLAYTVRERLASAGTQLDAWQFRGLALSCRAAKERLLSAGKETKHPVTILGRGRKVVGGSLRVEIERTEVERSLVEGFFPSCSVSDTPQAQRRTALQEIGLPYAADAAVTRHLAQFLSRHRAVDAHARPFACPTALLFNGGVMRAAQLRERLVDIANGWLRTAEAAALRVLSGADPEHAVARGAAYYGLARRGRGIRIRGGTARSFYLGIETAMPAVPGMRPPIKALCVVPHGLEEGSEVELPKQEFGLVVGEPAEFRFLSSATRRDDAVGTLVESWSGGEIEELPPLQTSLEWKGEEGTTVPVRLHARVTEVGVLELWFVTRDEGHRWKLEFNVRGPGAGGRGLGVGEGPS
jgi:actin-like ATPase involved in cell morphogenesis